MSREARSAVPAYVFCNSDAAASLPNVSRIPGHFYPIISPNASTAWNVGETATFVWNASTISQDTFDPSWVDLYHSPEGFAVSVARLADDFDLRTGSVQFVVPNAEPGDYFVMFNAWANSSPHFRIAAAN
ncbi:unnamed protein product [Somion occarium]|uniref:Uncharacterized protein n=1 Tax=Somion occarium TaxID=3059160 RepID=A0ABP1E7B5_9APHY